MCGFDSLDQEEIEERALEILSSTELKQSICHQILGASHKDVEKAMLSIVNNRNEKPDPDVEELPARPRQSTIDAIVPQKQKAQVPQRPRYRTLTPDECQALIEASNAPVVTPEDPFVMNHTKYPSLPREEAERLVREHFEYKEEEKRKKAEYDGIFRGRQDSKKEPAS